MASDKSSKPAPKPQSRPEPVRDLPQKETRKDGQVKGGRMANIDGAEPHL